jgi:hypothetical protein
MKLPLLPLGLLLALASPLCSHAQESSLVSKDSRQKDTKVDPNNSAVQVSGPTKRVSTGLSTAISSTLPKYTPPPPPPPPPPPEAQAEEGKLNEDGSMEIDDPEHNPSDPSQPRNKIIRLPKQVVQGNRPPIFKEKDLYDKQNLSKLAMKRYLSSLDRNFLNRYTLPLVGTSAEQRALAMYEENARLDNINDLKDAAANASRSGDKDEASYLRKEVDRTFIRSGGLDWTSRSKE